MKYHFYQLVDPRDNLPFYVGQTLDFERRRKDYLSGKGHSKPLDRRLKELEQAGLQPMMQELESRECTTDEALDRETYWIQHLSDQGIQLLNKSNGQRGWKQQTVYLPPALAKWLKVHAVQVELEISEIVAQALKEYRDKYSP